MCVEKHPMAAQQHKTTSGVGSDGERAKFAQ